MWVREALWNVGLGREAEGSRARARARPSAMGCCWCRVGMRDVMYVLPGGGIWIGLREVGKRRESEVSFRAVGDAAVVFYVDSCRCNVREGMQRALDAKCVSRWEGMIKF